MLSIFIERAARFPPCAESSGGAIALSDSLEFLKACHPDHLLCLALNNAVLVYDEPAQQVLRTPYLTCPENVLIARMAAQGLDLCQLPRCGALDRDTLKLIIKTWFGRCRYPELCQWYIGIVVGIVVGNCSFVLYD